MKINRKNKEIIPKKPSRFHWFSAIWFLLIVLFLSSCLPEKAIDEKTGSKDNKKPAAVAEKAYPVITRTNVTKTRTNVTKTLAPPPAPGVVPLRENTSISSFSQLANIQKAMSNFAYQEVISLSENSDDNEILYYRALAYFSMMLNVNNYSEFQRSNFGDRAEVILSNIIDQNDNRELLAKALIWQGILLDARYTSLQSKRQAIDAFFTIQQDITLKRGDLYDESLLYSGDVYSKMGWYIQARSFYRRLARLPSTDVTYDYLDNSFYSPQEAAQRGFERLDQYIQGSHSDYQ